jgi:L-threonylcarbamoyladenylate synthase
MVEILSINRSNPEIKLLDHACRILADGGLVVVPTETVYGIACDPSISGAMDKLIAAKGRDGDKPIAHLAASTKHVQTELAEWNPGIQILSERYWPGALTLVLKSATGWTGYRIPDHPVALALANRYGRTLALTSANLSGDPDTKTATEAVASVSADLALDSGPSAKEAIPSTVVKVNGNFIECLREGCIPYSEIEQLFKENLS